jgi:Dyp-type peroxidase family
MPELELEDIQGNVIRGYGMPVAEYVFLGIEAAEGGQRWLRDVIGHVRSAGPWEQKPASALNVSFSWQGLLALGLAREALDSFPPEFRAGMASRAEELGDTGQSGPEHWEGGFGGPHIHALAVLAARDESALAEHGRWLHEGVERAPGLRVVSSQRAAELPGRREHFGFADGFSQPTIEGSGVSVAPGQGVPDGRGGWRAVGAGEFVLGYPDEQGSRPDAPEPETLARNGSYLVYRKLHQDVAAFRRLLRENASGFPEGEELLAAKMVGRWPDGTPLELSPDRSDPDLAADRTRNNAFRYRVDDGTRCPVGAHIRRANPRDGDRFDGKLVTRHRMLRRGLTYGEPLPDGADADGAERGVIFMCFQASIARQFEFVQNQWFNDGNAFRLGDDKDPLVGDHGGTGKMTVEGAPPRFIHPLRRVVTVRGGEYFFTPGIDALRFLAAGAGAGS